MADFNWGDVNWGNAGQTAAGLLGGYLQGESAQQANLQTANQLQQAAEQAKFKPFGVSTAFGKSGFQYDPSGNLVGAGYQLAPGAQQQLDTLFGTSGGLLSQFTGAQGATAPMGQAAQSMMNLGNQYLGTSPQAQAAKYLSEQQALLAPGRAADMANLQAKLQAQGRGGLAIGGGIGGQGAANPQLQAMLNAQMQQDAQLASQATQGGMDYAKFGAGMVGTGGDMLRGMFGTQASAFEPYRTALGGATALDTLGQKTMDISSTLGSQRATGAGNVASGMQNAAPYQVTGQSYNPWAGLLMGQSSWGK